jgi:hypothetical protein
MRNYPINFVVKHPNRIVFFASGPPLGGRETFHPDPETWLTCFQIGVRLNHLLQTGGDLETVNDSCRELVVELNGIEPLTPCLQSRCSPN